jgi:hypothetical protein
MFGDCSIGCVSQIGATKQTGAPSWFPAYSGGKDGKGSNAVNEKTIDQIEEVLMCEISDEAVEAAGRVEIAGCGRLFAPAFSAVTCLHLTSFGRRFHHPPR